MTGAGDDLDDRREARVTVLPFALSDRTYCVALERVASVLGVTNESAIDGAADPWRAGSISVAGERVRVVDLQRVFAAATRPLTRVDEPRLLVFDARDECGSYVGWLVDAVGVAKPVLPSAVDPPRTAARFLEGRIELEGREVLWLDDLAING